MDKSTELAIDNQVQENLRRLFNIAAARSRSLLDLVEAEPEMADFLQMVKTHPEERAFVNGLFTESYLKLDPCPPEALLTYCMHDLRWPEMREFILRLAKQDAQQRGAAQYKGWGDMIKAFEDDWVYAQFYKRYS